MREGYLVIFYKLKKKINSFRTATIFSFFHKFCDMSHQEPSPKSISFQQALCREKGVCIDSLYVVEHALRYKKVLLGVGYTEIYIVRQ